LKIAYISSHWHWASYSVLRLLYEALRRRDGVEVVFANSISKSPADADQVWVFGMKSAFSKIPGKFSVVWGGTEPSGFKLARFRAADFYVTWSRIIQQRYPTAYYLSVFSDKRYFVPMPIEKTVECTFLGCADHPRVKGRREIIFKLRRAGIRVLAAGGGWEKHKHKDNRALLVGKELIGAFNRGYLALDLTNSTTSMSSRVFQAAMCGIPALTMRRADMAELFEPEREIFFYDKDSDIPKRVQELLKNKSLLAEVGAAARQRALRDHDVDARLDSLLKWTTKAYAEWKKK